MEAKEVTEGTRRGGEMQEMEGMEGTAQEGGMQATEVTEGTLRNGGNARLAMADEGSGGKRRECMIMRVKTEAVRGMID